MSSLTKRPSVFISYSSRDVTFAEELERRLNAAGTEVWRDRSRIEADWSREVATALANSRFVVMIWSSAAGASRWVRHEWTTARALELRLLVVALPDAPELPEPLRNLEITMAANLDDATSWLVTRIEGGAGHRYDYSILPGRSHIPFLPNPAFVGRESELVDLYLATIGDLNAMGRSVVGVTGLAGVGKTQLAVEFAYRFAHAFEAVLWMQGAEPLEWRAQCAQIGLYYLATDTSGVRDQTSAILRLHDALSQRIGRVLLVIDNVPDPALLNRDSTLGPDIPFTLLTLGASVLFTSRRTLRLPGVSVRSLDRLSDQSALKLVTRERSIADSDQLDAARGICHTLGNLPLGLVLVNGFLRKYSDVTFREYFSELRSRLVSTLDLSDVSSEELATRHNAAISATLAGHLDVLDDPARRLLTLIAQLPESAIVPRARLRLAFEGRGTGSVVLRLFDRAANSLVDVSLAERLEDADGVRLHPIVRLFVQEAFPDHAAVRASAAQQILSAYDVVQTLDTHARQRGIDEVADDLSLATAWAAPASETAGALAALGLVVERERLALKLRDVGPNSPWAVAQQLHWRAVQMARPTLAQRFEEYHPQARGCRLLLRVAGPVDDPALVRAARGPLQDEQSTEIRIIRADTRNRRVVTVSWKSAVIWDLDRLRPLRTVVHDRSYIRDACLAADGDSLWTIDSASRLYLWNAHTGEKLNEASVQLPADTAGVFELRSVQFVAGGRVLLCAYDSRKAFGDDWKRGLEEATAIVARWRLPEIRLDRTFEIDAHWLNAMAAGADGTVAVVPGGKDGTIALWNVDSGKRLKVFTGYTSKYATKSPSAIELDTVHDSLSAAINQSVVSWDLTTGEILHQVNGHEPLVNGLRMSADGRFVASTAAGGVRVAEPRRRQLVRTLRQARASAVEFVPDSSLLLSGERDETLILWNLDTPVAPQAITHDKAIRGLVAGDHDTMFSACEDRLVRWSATSPAQLLVAFEELVKGEKQTGDLVIDAAGRFAQGEPTTEAGNFSLGLWSQVRDCVVDREGKTALLGLTSGTTMHLNLQDGATRRLPSLDSPVVNCAFVDDSIAMSAGLNGTVQLYNLRRRRVTWTFDLGIKLRSAAVTRAASRAIFGGDDGEIVVIDLHARAIVMAIDYRIDDFARFQYRGTMNWQQAPTSVSISADGRRGLAAFILPGLVLLDVDSHAVRVLGTPHGSVGCASLSEDGRHALSGGLNGQLAFWDIDGGAPIASVIVDEEITAVTIAGNRFATGDASGRVCLGVIDGHLTSPFEPPADRGFSTSHEERDWCISPRPHRLRKPSPRGGKASSPRRRRVR